MSLRCVNSSGAMPPASPSKWSSKRTHVICVETTYTSSSDVSLDSTSSTTSLSGLLAPIINGTEIYLQKTDTKGGQEHTNTPTDEYDYGGGLESSLPKILDAEAIAQTEDSGKRKSSLYVDAFNLTLDTVLEEERYLFCEKEHEVFTKY